jgi:ribosomal protein L37AE/L43A
MTQKKLQCPKCEEVELTRVARKGFLQEHIYPKFGLYPWECGQCRQVFLLKARGKSYRRSRSKEPVEKTERRPSRST